MSSSFAALRCGNHSLRPAAGRCLKCQRSFCRECLTEHHGRLTCVSCLTLHTVAPVPRGSMWKHVAPPLLGVTALLGSWLFFYAMGSWLEWVTSPAPAATVSQP